MRGETERERERERERACVQPRPLGSAQRKKSKEEEEGGRKGNRREEEEKEGEERVEVAVQGMIGMFCRVKIKRAISRLVSCKYPPSLSFLNVPVDTCKEEL